MSYSQNDLLSDNRRMKQVIDQLNEDLLHLEHIKQKDQQQSMMSHINNQGKDIYKLKQIVDNLERENETLRVKLSQNDLINGGANRENEALRAKVQQDDQSSKIFLQNLDLALANRQNEALRATISQNDQNQTVANRLFLLQKEYDRVLQVNGDQNHELEMWKQRIGQMDNKLRQSVILDDQYINQINHLKQQLDQQGKVMAENDQYRIMIQKLEREIEDLRAQHQRDISYNQNFHQSSSEQIYSKHQQQLNEQNIDHQRRIGDNKQQMDHRMNEHTKDKDKEVYRLQDMLRKHQEDVIYQSNQQTQFYQNNMNIKFQNDQSNQSNQVQALLDQIQSWKNKHSDLGKSHANQLYQIEINYKTQIDKLMQELNIHKHEIQTYQKESQSYKNEIHSLNLQLQDMMRRLKDLDEMRHLLDEERRKNQALLKQIEELNKYIHGLQNQLQEAKEQISFQSTQVDSLHQKGNDLQIVQGQLGQFQNENRQLDTKCKNLEIQITQIPTLQDKLKNLRILEDEIARLNNQIHQIQEAYNALQITFRTMSRQSDQSDHWRDKFNDLLKELDYMRENDAKLTQQNDLLKSNYNALQNQNQQQQDQEGDKWKSRNLLLQDQISKLQYQAQDIEQMWSDRLIQKEQESTNRYGQFERQLIQMENEIVYLRKELEKSKREYSAQVTYGEDSDKIKEQLAMVQYQLTEANQKSQGLLTSNYDLQGRGNQAERVREENTNLRSQLDNLLKELQKLQRESELADQLRISFGNLQQALIEANQEIARLQKLNNSLQYQVDGMKGQINQYSESNQSLQIDQLMRDNEALRLEIERYRIRLAEIEPQLNYLLEIEQNHQKALGRFDRASFNGQIKY